MRRQHSRAELRYSTDLTDDERAIIEPLLPPAALSRELKPSGYRRFPARPSRSRGHLPSTGRLGPELAEGAAENEMALGVEGVMERGMG